MRGVHIEVLTTESSSYFLYTNVDVLEAFKEPRGRRYELYVSPLIFGPSTPLSEEGRRGILVHELVHLRSYLAMRWWNLAWLLVNIQLSDTFNARFERGTDLAAIRMGYGEGLIEYREWLYRQLNSTDREKRKKTYMTPEEIRDVMKSL